MGSGESVAGYVARAQDLYRDLIATGHEMKPEELAWSVMVGLPDMFDTQVQILQSTDSALTVESILPKLLLTESRAGLGTSKSKEEAGTVAFRAGRRGFGTTNLQSGNTRIGLDKSGGAVFHGNCYGCGEKGHTKRNCHNKKSETSKALFGVAYSSSMDRRGSLDGEWILDSGSTNHITGNTGWFTSLKPLEGDREIRFGNEGVLHAEGVGEVEILVKTPIGQALMTLQIVLYVTGAAANLFSVAKATEKGAEFSFSETSCKLKHARETLFDARMVGNVWVIPRVKARKAFLAREPESAELWHRRLGHAGYERLAQMASNGLVKGINVKPEEFRELKTVVCEPCVMGKQTREPFRKADSGISPALMEPLELVHTDVCGPMPVASKGGARFFFTVLDDASKLSVVVPVKAKSQVAGELGAVLTRLETQTGRKVKSVRSDRGTEYVNEEFTGFLRERGIVHQTTARYTPEQNGAAERLNRELEERTRAMLEHLGLPPALWAEAVVTANYTRNRTPVAAHGKTPWEAFWGEKPGVGHMRVFGARAYIHVPKELRKKLDMVSERGRFVGYEPNAKAYRVLRERDGRILASRDVLFDETAQPAKAVASEFELNGRATEQVTAEKEARPKSGTGEKSAVTGQGLATEARVTEQRNWEG
jgi:transposase InsO family protein